jgi:uncharacterized membrane protein HdeD (DUF308 family)
MTHKKKENVPMTTEKVSSILSRLWKSMLALGVLTLVAGVVVLIWPGQSIVAMAALFGVYLLVSGITQVIAAFALPRAPGGSRLLLFISGALSFVLSVFAFRDFNDGAAVYLLTIWIAIGFISQGVAGTVIAMSVPKLPERGWYVVVGVLSVIAGMVMLVWPINSIAVLAIFAGAWLVVLGGVRIVWALNARSTAKKVQRGVEPLTGGAAA